MRLDIKLMVKLTLTVKTPWKNWKKTVFKNYGMMCVDWHCASFLSFSYPERVQKKAVNVTLLQSNLSFGLNIQMSLIWEETQTDVLSQNSFCYKMLHGWCCAPVLSYDWWECNFEGGKELAWQKEAAKDEQTTSKTECQPVPQNRQIVRDLKSALGSW